MLSLLLFAACVRASTEPSGVALTITNQSNDTTVSVPISKSTNENGFLSVIGIRPDGLEIAFDARVIVPKGTVRIPFGSLMAYTPGGPLVIVTTRPFNGVTNRLRVTELAAEKLAKNGSRVSASAA